MYSPYVIAYFIVFGGLAALNFAGIYTQAMAFV
jgi:hypothetical protein